MVFMVLGLQFSYSFMPTPSPSLTPTLLTQLARLENHLGSLKTRLALQGLASLVWFLGISIILTMPQKPSDLMMTLIWVLSPLFFFLGVSGVFALGLRNPKLSEDKSSLFFSGNLIDKTAEGYLGELNAALDGSEDGSAGTPQNLYLSQEIIKVSKLIFQLNAYRKMGAFIGIAFFVLTIVVAVILAAAPMGARNDGPSGMQMQGAPIEIRPGVRSSED